MTIVVLVSDGGFHLDTWIPVGFDVRFDEGVVAGAGVGIVRDGGGVEVFEEDGVEVGVVVGDEDTSGAGEAADEEVSA